MNATIQNINVLDKRADALIYSTNILLNCTGGVGACLVERFGHHLQSDLHELLKGQGSRFADQGSVFQHVSTGMPYAKVFHTVPCDGFYNTTPEIVADILRKCLRECVTATNVQSVALSALATGYGRLGFDELFRVASLVLAEEDFASLGNVTICIEDAYSYGLASDQIEAEALKLTTS